MNFNKSYALCKVPPWLLALSEQENFFPHGAWHNYTGGYAFPPGFMPIIIEDSLPACIGIFRCHLLKAGFVYCYYSFEDGEMRLVAKNNVEFAAYLCVLLLGMGEEDGIINEFAVKVGVVDLARLAKIAWDCDYCSTWQKKYFHTSAFEPKVAVGELDWVVDLFESLEHGTDINLALDNKLNSAGHQIEQCFRRASDEKNHSLAWLYLNMPGWGMADAQKSCRSLIRGCESIEPSLLKHIQYWTETPDITPDHYGY